jgi:hypothetical protein
VKTIGDIKSSALTVSQPVTPPQLAVSTLTTEQNLNLLFWLLGHRQARELLEALNITKLVIAVDANIMLQDVPRYQRTRKPTGLFIALRSPFVTVTMSSEDITEVHLHLERRCNGDSVLLETLRTVWRREYVPHIRVLDASRIPLNPRAERLRSRDPDDLNLAQQSQLVGADHMFTLDTDFEEFAPVDVQWSQLAAAVHTIAVQQGVLVKILGTNLTVTVAVGVGAVVTVNLIKATFSIAMSLLRRVPPLLLLLGVLAAVGILLQPKRRNALVEVVRQLPATVKAILDNFVMPIVADQTQLTRSALEKLQPARTYQQTKRIPGLVDTTARGYAASALARTHTGLTLDELLERMRETGYRSRAHAPKTYIRRVLHKYPEVFVCNDQGRWSISWSVAEIIPSPHLD